MNELQLLFCLRIITKLPENGRRLGEPIRWLNAEDRSTAAISFYLRDAKLSAYLLTDDVFNEYLPSLARSCTKYVQSRYLTLWRERTTRLIGKREILINDIKRRYYIRWKHSFIERERVVSVVLSLHQKLGIPATYPIAQRTVLLKFFKTARIVLARREQVSIAIVDFNAEYTKNASAIYLHLLADAAASYHERSATIAQTYNYLLTFKCLFAWARAVVVKTNLRAIFYAHRSRRVPHVFQVWRKNWQSRRVYSIMRTIPLTQFLRWWRTKTVLNEEYVKSNICRKTYFYAWRRTAHATIIVNSFQQKHQTLKSHRVIRKWYTLCKYKVLLFVLERNFERRCRLRHVIRKLESYKIRSDMKHQALNETVRTRALAAYFRRWRKRNRTHLVSNLKGRVLEAVLQSYKPASADVIALTRRVQYKLVGLQQVVHARQTYYFRLWRCETAYLLSYKVLEPQILNIFRNTNIGNYFRGWKQALACIQIGNEIVAARSHAAAYSFVKTWHDAAVAITIAQDSIQRKITEVKATGSYIANLRHDRLARKYMVKWACVLCMTIKKKENLVSYIVEQNGRLVAAALNCWATVANAEVMLLKKMQRVEKLHRLLKIRSCMIFVSIKLVRRRRIYEILEKRWEPRVNQVILSRLLICLKAQTYKATKIEQTRFRSLLANVIAGWRVTRHLNAKYARQIKVIEEMKFAESIVMRESFHAYFLVWATTIRVSMCGAIISRLYGSERIAGNMLLTWRDQKNLVVRLKLNFRLLASHVNATRATNVFCRWILAQLRRVQILQGILRYLKKTMVGTLDCESEPQSAIADELDSVRPTARIRFLVRELNSAYHRLNLTSTILNPSDVRILVFPYQENVNVPSKPIDIIDFFKSEGVTSTSEIIEQLLGLITTKSRANNTVLMLGDAVSRKSLKTMDLLQKYYAFRVSRSRLKLATWRNALEMRKPYTEALMHIRARIVARGVFIGLSKLRCAWREQCRQVVLRTYGISAFQRWRRTGRHLLKLQILQEKLTWLNSVLVKNSFAALALRALYENSIRKKYFTRYRSYSRKVRITREVQTKLRNRLLSWSLRSIILYRQRAVLIKRRISTNYRNNLLSKCLEDWFHAYSRHEQQFERLTKNFYQRILSTHYLALKYWLLRHERINLLNENVAIMKKALVLSAWIALYEDRVSDNKIVCAIVNNLSAYHLSILITVSIKQSYLEHATSHILYSNGKRLVNKFLPMLIKYTSRMRETRKILVVQIGYGRKLSVFRSWKHLSNSRNSIKCGVLALEIVSRTSLSRVGLNVLKMRRRDMNIIKGTNLISRLKSGYSVVENTGLFHKGIAFNILFENTFPCSYRRSSLVGRHRDALLLISSRLETLLDYRKSAASWLLQELMGNVRVSLLSRKLLLSRFFSLWRYWYGLEVKGKLLLSTRYHRVLSFAVYYIVIRAKEIAYEAQVTRLGSDYVRLECGKTILLTLSRNILHRRNTELIASYHYYRVCRHYLVLWRERISYTEDCMNRIWYMHISMLRGRAFNVWLRYLRFATRQKHPEISTPLDPAVFNSNETVTTIEMSRDDITTHIAADKQYKNANDFDESFVEVRRSVDRKVEDIFSRYSNRLTDKSDTSGGRAQEKPKDTENAHINKHDLVSTSFRLKDPLLFFREELAKFKEKAVG